MNTGWPPILGVAHVPWWARARDVLLTLLAWGAMAWLLRWLLLPLWGGLRYLVDPRHVPVPLELERVLLELLPYALAVLVVVLGLVVFALRNRAVLRAQPRADGAPDELDAALQAARFGLQPQMLEALHSASVMRVRFDARGYVEAVDRLRRPC